MGPAQAIRTCLAKSFQFSGRASRPEYWWFVPICIMFTLSLSYLIGAAFDQIAGHLPTIIALKCLNVVVAALLLLPLSVIARRHHDIGFPAFLVMHAVPLVTINLICSLLFAPLFMGFHIDYALELLTLNWFTLPIYFILLGLSSLAALWPSTPGPNRYGPNPSEVTP